MASVLTHPKIAILKAYVLLTVTLLAMIRLENIAVSGSHFNEKLTFNLLNWLEDYKSKGPICFTEILK